MLPKLDVRQLEEGQATILKKMDELNVLLKGNAESLQKTQQALLSNMDKLTQGDTVEKMYPFVVQTADNLYNLTSRAATNDMLAKIFPFVVQIADNLYNIGGKLDAQLTSFKEVQDFSREQLKGVDAQVTSLKEVKDALKEGQPTEGQQLEAQREAPGDGKPLDPKKEEKKQRTIFEILGELFEKILIPLVFGFIVGLSKALGFFNTTFGKIVTILGAIGVALLMARGSLTKALVGFVKGLANLPGVLKGAFDKLKGGLGAVKDKLFGPKPGAAAPGLPGGGVPGGAVPGGAPEVPGGVPEGKKPKGPSGLDNFLKGAQKVGKSIKDFFVGIADTISKVLGKLADGIKQVLTKVSQGLKSLLTNVAKGIESFGSAKVLKGAAALVVVSGALYIAAKAFKEFNDVNWDSLAKGGIAILGLVGVMQLLKGAAASILLGAAALVVMGGALYVAAKGFQQFNEVNWKALAVAAVGITGLSVALVALAPLLPVIALGSVSLTLMGAALGAFGLGMQAVAAALPAFSEFLGALGKLNGGALLSAAAGIVALSGALIALGGATVINAITGFVGKLLSFGEDDIFTKLTNLGKVAGDLNQLPGTLKALGDLSNFKVSSNFMDNVDLLAEGLEKIAEAAEDFEDTGDALEALARIAEAMNKPMAMGGGGAAPAPAGTSGKAPAAAPAAGTTPARTAPTQTAARPYSDQDIKKQEKFVAQMEKSGNKSGAAAARARLQNMQSQNKQADAAAKMTPEQRQAIAEGRPVAAQAKPAAQPVAARQEAATQAQPGQGVVQAVPKQQSNEELAAAERNLAIAEKASGGKPTAAVTDARARVEEIKQRDKYDESFERLTPGQQQAFREGRRATPEEMKPVPTAASGQAVAQDSQNVAAATGGAGGNKNTAVINAPSSSVVNAPSNQTVNMPMTAHGKFGGSSSHGRVSHAFGSF